MRALAVAVMVVIVGGCSDALTGDVNKDAHPGSAISATVGPAGGLVRTPNGYAAVRIDPGILTQDVTVRLERVNEKYPPGRGPLRTKHVQYAAAYRLTMSPPPTIAGGVSVALCAGEGVPFQGPDELHHRLRYVFSPLGGGVNEEAVVAPSPGGSANMVNCTARTAHRNVLGRLLAALGPTTLYAIDQGGGGEYAGGCTHPGCIGDIIPAPAPFPGLIIGVIDPATFVK